MEKRKVPLQYAYRMLSPGPFVLISSFYKGRPNVMPLTWIMPLDFSPPKVAMVLSEENYSFECITKTGEFVVNIPHIKLLKKCVQCGETSGNEIDKFKEFGLTATPAATVKAPLVKECIGHLECKLFDKQLTRRYSLFLGSVTCAWANSGTFRKRWLVEKPEARFITHLGARGFAYPKYL